MEMKNKERSLKMYLPMTVIWIWKKWYVDKTQDKVSFNFEGIAFLTSMKTDLE